MALYVQAGDVFFTKSKTILGRLIRWGEKDKGEVEATWANHAGVVVEDGWIGETPAFYQRNPGAPEAVVIEALGHVRKGPLVLNGTEVRVFRPVPPWTALELARFRSTAEPYVGDKYGWWKLLFQLADKLVGRKLFTTLLHNDERPICSYLAAKVVQAAEDTSRITARITKLGATMNGRAYFSFGMPPQAVDPDEGMDFCLAHPELWQEVKG